MEDLEAAPMTESLTAVIARPITNMTERQLIESILAVYRISGKAGYTIAKHIAEKLVVRRTLLRKARKKGIKEGE